MQNNRKQQPLNLLDLVLPATTADTNIHTFIEFKQWINTSFKIKTQLNVGDVGSSTSKHQMIKKSRKIKPSKSLAGENVHIVASTVKRVPTISYKMLEDIQEGMLEQSNLTKLKSVNSHRHQNLNDELGLQLKENSNFGGSKSAHSSRSFRGYLQINQYQLRKRIGKGSFAEVFLSYDIETNQKYAVKIMQTKQLKKKFQLKKNAQLVDNNSSNSDNSQTQTKNIVLKKTSLASLFIRNEVAILKKMNHQNITKLHDVIVDNENSKVYLVLEYCGGGFINQSKEESVEYKKLLQSQCRRYYKQLCLVVDYIHNVAKISHRDIKPQNILLSQNDEVKLSDFGLGTHKLKGAKASGTPLYMPPPSNTKQDDSSLSNDIWALGVTLIVMLTGKTPQFINQKINTQKLLSSMKDVSDNCKDFISKCLQLDPKKRIKAQQLIQHSWLNIGQDLLKQSLGNMNKNIQISAADELNIFTTIQIKKEIDQPADNVIEYKFNINI